MVRDRMTEARNARLVSGEIMAATGSPEGSPRREPHFDFVDAEFETLDRAGGGARAASARAVTPPIPVSAGQGSASAAGMDMLRKQKLAPRPLGSVRGGPLFWTVGLSLVAAAFWFSGGHALMPRDMPGMTQVSAEPLRIASVVSRVDTSGARTMLNIDGEAVNEGGKALPMPPLTIQVVAGDGATTHYNLGTSGSPVGPGEKFAFASRLPVPRNGIKSVSVAFDR